MKHWITASIVVHGGTQEMRSKLRVFAFEYLSGASRTNLIGVSEDILQRFKKLHLDRPFAVPSFTPNISLEVKY